MRKNFRGTAAACAVTILVTALSGCSGLSVDAAQGTGSAPVREPSSDPKAEQLGRPHNPAAGDNPRSRGADENAGGEAGNSDGKSSDESAIEKRGESVGEGARPAGHEGLWFDSEPQDPWDKYVWKSQKFIGKGGEIPKLGPGTADKNFWGLPDLCSTQMQKKMGEVGFEFRKRINWMDESGCWFQYSGADMKFIGGGVARFSYSKKPRGENLSELSKSLGVPLGWRLVRTGNEGGGRCLLTGKYGIKGGTESIFQSFVDGSLEALDLEQECSHTYQFSVVVMNVLTKS